MKINFTSQSTSLFLLGGEFQVNLALTVPVVFLKRMEIALNNNLAKQKEPGMENPYKCKINTVLKKELDQF